MKKAVFVDVDGTLTKDISSWEKAHHHFGAQDKHILDEMEKNTELYFAGKIDYFEWARMDVALWKGQPFTELEKALLPPVLIPRAKEGVKLLKDEGYDVILVSGGIDILVNAVAKEVDADEAYSNKIHHTDGVIDGRVTIGVGKKAPVIRKVERRMGYVLSNSIAIGDNVNDIDMFQTVGFSVALNARDEDVMKTATMHAVSNDFADFISQLLQWKNQNGKNL